MSDLGELARDPKHRRQFEKLLYLSCKKGEVEEVKERLGWGIDPNCSFAKGTTPLIANIRASCPSTKVIHALLNAGADPEQMDHAGLTALDYARRKLSRVLGKDKQHTKSPSLDENNQLQLDRKETAAIDEMREELPPDERTDFLRHYWKERFRAAHRTFNDPAEVEKIVDILEGLHRE